MMRNEFKPPNDFVDEDSDSGGTSIWKWLGIGCGAIVLIVGVLMVFGVWKSVSCCQEMGQAVEGAAAFSVQFAEDVADEDIDSARAKMSERLASATTDEQLRARIEEYRAFFEASPPLLTDQTLDESSGLGDEQMRFRSRIDFSPDTGGEKLVMFVDVIAEEQGDEHSYEVDDFEFDVRPRKLSAEPPAQSVLTLHNELQAGEYENAYGLMTDALAEEQDAEGFRNFVREHQDIFVEADVDIVSVDYAGQTQARVRAEAVDGDQVIATIEYLVESPERGLPRWHIASIHPNYLEEPVPAEETEASDDGGDEAEVDEDEMEAEEADDPAETETNE